MVALRIEQALAQIFRFGMIAGCLANAMQGGVERWDFGSGLKVAKLACVAEASDLTGF